MEMATHLSRARPAPSQLGLAVAVPVVMQITLVLGYVWTLWALRAVPESQSNLTITALYAPVEIIAAAMAFVAAHSAEGRMRRGWLLVAGAMACSAVVNLDWVWAALDPSHTFGVPIYVVVYAQYPLALWAFASFPTAGGDDVDRRTYLLDAAIVIVAAAVLAWHFVFREILARDGSGALATVRMLSYTVLCLAVVFAALALYLRRPARPVARSIGLLTIAWVLIALACTLQMRAQALKTSLNAIEFNACFAAAACLVAIAAAIFTARMRRANVEDIASPQVRASTRVPSHVLLPYAAIAAVFGVLLLQVHRATTSPTRETIAPLMTLVLGAIAITVIVGVRQIMAQRRNAMLVAERLRREAHFRALVQHASDVILVVDLTGVIREASPSVRHTLGLSPESLQGCVLASIIATEDQAVMQADFAQLAARRLTDGCDRPSAPCEWRVRAANGEVRWLEVLCTNLLDDQAVRGIVINGRDVSERKVLEAELTRLAYFDSLTGLVNRARFRRIVEDALEVGDVVEETSERATVAVLYVDLDDFKPVNDAYGHSAGDRVLAVVTERLKDATRGSDVVARLGGDEFALLLEQVRDVDEATAVARRVLERVQKPIRIGNATVLVGASIGIACTDIGLDTTYAGEHARSEMCEALLRDADEAMYAAKVAGGRRFVVYAPRVHRSV